MSQSVDAGSYDISNPDFQGFLTKRSKHHTAICNYCLTQTLHEGMWLKEWRRRYFILKGNKLFFSKGSTVSLRRVMSHCCKSARRV
jgi:hypothetical protein